MLDNGTQHQWTLHDADTVAQTSRNIDHLIGQHTRSMSDRPFKVTYPWTILIKTELVIPKGPLHLLKTYYDCI